MVRRVKEGIGGAEKAAARMGAMFSADWNIQMIHADSPPAYLAGSRGPSWWRAWRFARAANDWFNKRQQGLIFSMERGVDCDIYRAGDGVHNRWVELSGHRYRSWFNPLHWVVPRLERRSVRSARYIVANSTMVANDFKSAYPEAAHKIRVIHNGVDRDLYYPAKQSLVEIRRALRLTENMGFELILVGSGWARKGLVAALRLLELIRKEDDSRLSQTRLVIVGKGKPQRYKKLIRALKLDRAVVFTGPVANPRDYYQQADALILPTRYDPFANTCLEALACGCKVVTTTTNGAAEVIQDGVNGIVIPGQIQSGNLAYEARRIAHMLINNHSSKHEISATVADYTIKHESIEYSIIINGIAWPSARPSD